METVRQVIKHRDSVSDAEVDELFEELAAVLSDGTDPEEALAEVFGLEPDYVMDAEVWAVLEQHAS